MRTRLTIGLLVIVALLAVAFSPPLQRQTFGDVIVKKLTVLAGGTTLQSAATFQSTSEFQGLVDITGQELTLDADNDTSITADTDDQIDFEIGGSDEVVLTAATLDMNNTYIDQDQDTENIGSLPTILSVPITYTAAAGGSGTVATVGDGEIWLIHKVFIQVTTNFDATGDDATLVIGDGNDADGFVVAADANLQATFTEATGYAAGWYGLENGSNGAYTVDDGAFVYAPSGAAETIDYLIDETSGETLSAGAATIYVLYTRLQ